MPPDDERLAAARIEESQATVRGLGAPETVAELVRMARLLVEGFSAGAQLLIFGNGGSAEQAQHLAGELVGRLRLQRAPLPAVSLSDNTAAMTAIANDYGYGEVFARQVEGFGRPGDIALALSTSGRSENVLRGVQAARRGGLATLAMTGPEASPLAEAVDLCLRAPGAETTRVQECHLVATHVLCELVERALA